MSAIASIYGPTIVAEVNQAISTYSVKEVVPDGIPSTVPIEVTDGLRLLGQPLVC